jgi:hypothetical protein
MKPPWIYAAHWDATFLGSHHPNREEAPVAPPLIDERTSIIVIDGVSIIVLTHNRPSFFTGRRLSQPPPHHAP